jgi:hypothetical protein
MAEGPAAAWRELTFAPGDRAWQISRFGGEGPVGFEPDGTVSLGRGDPLTGIRYRGDIARDGYELELEARRVEGIDFFCGLTFPVGEQRCSLIVGGWAGTILGLSNVDGEDAAHNPTQRIETYENDRWYRVRVRVSARRIAAWIDEELKIDQPREGHDFDIRPEVEPSLPLGLAVFASRAEARGMRIRELETDES